MPTKKQFVKSYLTPEEHKTLQNKVSQTGLSVSQFVRNVCLNYQVTSLTDHKAVLALMKANADLGRMEGLLKHHLTTNPKNPEIRSLCKTIEAKQLELLPYFTELIDALLERKKRHNIPDTQTH